VLKYRLVILANRTEEPEGPRTLAQLSLSAGRVDDDFDAGTQVEDSNSVVGQGDESPSNRRDSSLVSREINSEEAGVDRLSVSFVVYDFDSDGDNWDSYAQQHSQQRSRDGSLVETYSRQVEVVEGVDAFVGVRVITAKSRLAAVYGKVEFNPARVVDPDGHGLASVDETLGALSTAVVAAECVLVPVRHDELTSYKIKRIDVARDFRSVLSPSALIRGLAPIPRNWARRNLVHADPSKHGAQTLMVGSGAGVVRLYDKFAEAGGGVEPGTVRWEAEVRAAWASQYGGLVTVSDLMALGIDDLARNRWEWSAMGVEVTSILGAVDAVLRSGMTEREATMFLGWLVREGTPWAWSPSFTTSAKFRRYQRELGISVGPEALKSVACSSRLDWETGREILRLDRVANGSQELPA
jgi:hypothetical protein